jgi:hypothetical protein
MNINSLENLVDLDLSSSNKESSFFGSSSIHQLNKPLPSASDYKLRHIRRLKTEMSSNLAKRGVNHQMQTASDAHFKKNQKG